MYIKVKILGEGKYHITETKTLASCYYELMVRDRVKGILEIDINTKYRSMFSISYFN